LFVGTILCMASVLGFVDDVFAEDFCDCNIEFSGTNSQTVSGIYFVDQPEANNLHLRTTDAALFSNVQYRSMFVNCSLQMKNLFSIPVGGKKQLPSGLKVFDEGKAISDKNSIACGPFLAAPETIIDIFKSDLSEMVSVQTVDDCFKLNEQIHNVKISKQDGQGLLIDGIYNKVTIEGYYVLELNNCKVRKADGTQISSQTDSKPAVPDTIPSARSLNKIGALDISTFIGRAIKGALGFMGSIAFVMYIYGGVLYMTAAGNAQREESARKVLVWTTIGIMVILSSYVIVDFIFQGFKG
jgi:hypothetical protein